MHTRSQAPNFTGCAIKDSCIDTFDLASTASTDGWTVVVYLQAFRHSSEVLELAAATPTFDNRQARLVIVAQDSEYALLTWQKQLNTNLLLVSDKTRQLKQAWNIGDCATFLLDRNLRVVHESHAVASPSEILRILDGFIFAKEHGQC